MPFQTHRTFVHLRNTNEDIFNDTWEIYVPPFTVTKTFKRQVHKGVVKVTHVTLQWFNPSFLKRYECFIHKIRSLSHRSQRPIQERTPTHVCCVDTSATRKTFRKADKFFNFFKKSSSMWKSADIFVT